MLNVEQKRRMKMTNEEVYKKAIRLSKEDLIDMIIEWNNDNRRLRDIILKYEEYTNADIKEMGWIPQHPYSGYRVKVNDNFEYCRDVSGSRTEKNIV